MRYCSQCGKELVPGAKFCSSCGHKVEEESFAAQESHEAEQSAQTENHETEQSGQPQSSPLVMEKKLPINIIGGIIFIILGIWSMGSVFSAGYMAFWHILETGAFVLLAVAMLSKTRYPLVPIALAAETLCSLVYLINGLINGKYTTEIMSYYSYYDETHFNLLCILPDLLSLLAVGAACFAVFAMGTNLLEKYRKTAENLWFVPALIEAASILLSIILYIAFYALNIFNIYWIYGWYSFSSFLYGLLYTAGLAAVLLNLKYPECAAQRQEAPSAEADQQGAQGAQGDQNDQSAQYASRSASSAVYTTQNVTRPDGYCSMVKHVLLLIFTFGIWQLIWIYRTTRYLNCVTAEPPRNPTTKLLLCMFVPFYIIYWMYKHAKYIDILAAEKGIPSDIGVLCLVLEFFVPIVPPILMQDKLNTIVGVAL
ncbi:MAG: DUF4234 domain-containing protein [Anaerovoracaceae bacterium]|nr:DUF4234 domain-containing protein [Anaerovoracaceae bacterium]